MSEKEAISAQRTQQSNMGDERSSFIRRIYDCLNELPSIFDSEFSRIMVSINNFLMKKNKGVSLSMFLSSVDHGFDEFVYQYQDITRSGTLALIVDEIKSRSLEGEIAELGVAYGSFAKIMNKLLPEKEDLSFRYF